MWHDNVQHHQIRVLGRGLLHRFFAITRGDDVVPCGGQGFGDQLEGSGTVVNNKDFTHGLCLPLRKVSSSARTEPSWLNAPESRNTLCAIAGASQGRESLSRRCSSKHCSRAA